MADAADAVTGNMSLAFASANRGALTTIFTPPGTCLTETTLVSYTTSVSSVTTAFITTKIFINHFSWGDPDCYPSTIATISDYTRWNNGYYYSPGICPSGWTSACVPTGDDFGFSTTISTDTSVAICCPSSWTCVGGATSFAAHGCSVDLFVGQTLTSVWPAAMPTPDISMPLPERRVLTAWEITSDTSALCDAIPVMWQNTDVQILSLLGDQITIADAPSAQVTTITMSKTIPSQTGMIQNSPVITLHTSAFSDGARVGIGVTIPIVMLALLLGIFFFFRRRKSLEKIEQNIQAGDLEQDRLDHTQKRELHTEGLPLEMDANRETRELESARVVYEMPDTSLPEASRREVPRPWDPSPSNYMTEIVSKRFSAPNLNEWSGSDTYRTRLYLNNVASMHGKYRSPRHPTSPLLLPLDRISSCSPKSVPAFPYISKGPYSNGDQYVNSASQSIPLTFPSNLENMSVSQALRSTAFDGIDMVSPISTSPVTQNGWKDSTKRRQLSTVSPKDSVDTVSPIIDRSQRRAFRA